MRTSTILCLLVRTVLGPILVLLITILINNYILALSLLVDSHNAISSTLKPQNGDTAEILSLQDTAKNDLQNLITEERTTVVTIVSNEVETISTLSLRPVVPHSSKNVSIIRSINIEFQTSLKFTWPQPRAVRPVREIIRNEQWWEQLKKCLIRLNSHEVILLTSNQPYTEVLLNWLIAAVKRASVNLNQVVVIAMDSKLHSLLQERNISSILVRPKSLLTPTAVKEGIFPAVMMTRLSIIRLINHWGYHVFNFDTDAVLLRDPFPLFSSRDHITGTFGRFPRDLTKKWGITLCTAVLVVRSSKQTEEFWERVSQVAHSSFSDQGKMNYGLQAMEIRWNLQSRNLGSLGHPVSGDGRNGLRVSLLPYNMACRAGSCTNKALSAGLYVWHKGGARQGDRKKAGAEGGGVWFLHPDWTSICEGIKGKQWLMCISN